MYILNNDIGKVENPPRLDYFVCELTSGEVMNFDGWCNKVTTWSKCDNFIAFLSANDDAPFYEATLALIPASDIRQIICHPSPSTLKKSLEKVNDVMIDNSFGPAFIPPYPGPRAAERRLFE